MGWTWTSRNGRTVKEFLTREFNFETDEHKTTIIDYSLVRLRTAYLAVERVSKQDPDGRRVFGVVVLLGYAPQSDYNIGYKAIDETMGPCDCACPERILKQLTPTDSEWANGWRKKCWERIEKRKRRPKLQVGDVVTFRTPVTTYEGPKSTGVVQSTKPVVMSLDGRFYRFSVAQLSCPEEYSVSRAGKMIHQSGSKSDNPEISESFS